MNFYVVCCILAQIPYLGKIWFLRYRSKYSKKVNHTVGVLNYLLLEQNDEKAFLHVDKSSWKLKVY